MFSPYSNENLIEENTLQIAEKVLYSFGDAENKSIVKPIKYENKKSAFANFASIFFYFILTKRINCGIISIKKVGSTPCLWVTARSLPCSLAIPIQSTSR